MRALPRNYNVVPLAFHRRTNPRRPAHHIGKILTEPTAPPEYCLVTETSESGVRIYIAPDFEAPSVFTLRFQDTEARYTVIWRNGQFVGAEPASQKVSGTHKTIAIFTEAAPCEGDVYDFNAFWPTSATSHTMTTVIATA